MAKTQNKTTDLIIITIDYFLGEEEWYTDFFECPECKTQSPARHTKFCRGCGKPIVFNAEVMQKINAPF